MSTSQGRQNRDGSLEYGSAVSASSRVLIGSYRLVQPGESLLDVDDLGCMIVGELPIDVCAVGAGVREALKLKLNANAEGRVKEE